MPKITAEQLNLHFTSTGAFYPLSFDSIKLYNELRVHAYGEFPKAMIEARRPSESEEILDYRQKTYKPITKLPVSKVISSFGKIRRSQDWAIEFPPVKLSGQIIEEETLEYYCTNNIPGYDSITNWAFGILLKQNLIDPNAVVAVLPLEDVKVNEFIKPVPILFHSDQIIALDEVNKYCILRSQKKVNYYDTTNLLKSGNIFYYIDDIEIIVYEQQAAGFMPVLTIKNVTGQMPVFKVKAEAYVQYDNMVLQRSRLDAMVPFLDEAACEYSDLKGSKIQHLYPLFWYYQNKNCNSCSGTGKVPATTTDGQPTQCKTCHGEGKIKFSPFAHIQVDPATIGQQANPVPPAGYISRDTAILELQEKSVDKNIFRALGSINMQFLDQTPLSISGDAKSVDREELNNTVYTFAEDLIYSIDKAIYFINEWRYSGILTDKKKRNSQLPKIPVPQNFDLLPADYLMNEVTQARNNKANPFLLATLEQQVAVKKFYNEPEIAELIGLFFDLDPLPGYGVDEKMSLLSNKGCTLEDYLISSYCASFVKRAIIDDASFAAKSFDDKMKIMVKYAQEKMKTNDAASQMIDAQRQAVLLEMQQNQPAPGAKPNPAA